MNASASPMQRGLRDLASGLGRRELWMLVAWHDIRQRYRRSIIGPFWLTLSMAIMIGGLGLVYARLWQTSSAAYLPHLTVGLVCWSLIATVLLDACQVFIGAAGLIRQLAAPLSLYVFQMLFRNLVIFAHHLLIIAVVLPLCGVWPGWQAALALPGLILLLLNGAWVSFALGMLSARYRDVPQIMQSLVQILFFLTPVIWTTDRLGAGSLVLDLNPLHHLLELVRTPLLGQAPSGASWLFAAALALAGWLVTLLAFARYRARIAYWV